MKQNIYRDSNGNIGSITNYNNSGQLHGLHIVYQKNGDKIWQRNFINNKQYGLETEYVSYTANSPTKHIYHL